MGKNASEEICELADKALRVCRAAELTIVTAESCTGGLIAAALTEIAGSSDTFEGGFVTYSNRAKFEMLGVPLNFTDGSPGAVSSLVAGKMAEGALECTKSGIAIAVTGIAGPGGGTAEKPVGLVYIAVQTNGQKSHIEECRFGNIGRAEIRQRSVIKALEMLIEAASADRL